MLQQPQLISGILTVSIGQQHDCSADKAYTPLKPPEEFPEEFQVRLKSKG